MFPLYEIRMLSEWLCVCMAKETKPNSAKCSFERVKHTVWVDSFLISSREHTNEQWICVRQKRDYHRLQINHGATKVVRKQIKKIHTHTENWATKADRHNKCHVGMASVAKISFSQIKFTRPPQNKSQLEQWTTPSAINSVAQLRADFMFQTCWCAVPIYLTVRRHQ